MLANLDAQPDQQVAASVLSPSICPIISLETMRSQKYTA